MIKCKHVYKRGGKIHPKGSVCGEECKNRKNKVMRRCDKHFDESIQWKYSTRNLNRALIRSLAIESRVIDITGNDTEEVLNVDEVENPPSYEEAMSMKRWNGTIESIDH